MSVKLSKRKGAETKASSVATAQPINVQNFVDKKLAVNKTIEVTTPTAFPNDESDANNWSISVLVKYLKEILELPQYVEKFKRCEIDGSKFISMDESNLSAIEVTNQFHALKISSHAQILREQVLEKAMVEKPESVLDWGPNHIAAWLFYEKSCPETAVRVLKAKLTGYKMKSTTGKNAVSSMKALDLPEAAKAINSLDELAQKAKMAENNATNANINDNERKLTENDAKATIDQGVSNDDQVGTDSKPKKSKTAMKKSREKLKAVEMNSGNNKLDVRSEDGDEKCRNDSLPEEQTAYGTAMSAIYSGVQHIVGRSAVVGSTPLTPIVELTDSEGDDKIPYTSSSAPSHKKKKHLKRVGKNINELPESESEFIPEDESKQSASIPVHPPDIYTKSSERKKFLSKITNLRKVVAEHASSMSELRQHAQQLRSENVAIKEQQKQLLMQGTHSSELISSLVEDRNVALAELERITSLYGQHATAERDEAVRDLQLLARDTYKAKRETQEIWQSHNAQLSQLGNLNVNSTPTSATVLPQAQPVGNGTRTREKFVFSAYLHYFSRVLLKLLFCLS